MSLDHAVRRLLDRIEQMERIIARQQVRINSMIREGKVTAVDYENGLVTVDAHGVVSKPVPWMEQAGAISEWNPPAVGQRVTLFSPGGDPGRGFVLPGGYTDDNPAPHDQGGQKRTKIGDCVITQSASGLVFSVGGTTFEFTAGGFTQTGGTQEHNGKNVGSDHTHTGVIPGGGLTGPPT